MDPFGILMHLRLCCSYNITSHYICFGLLWNNPRGAQIGTPFPAGGLRKQARCCPIPSTWPGRNVWVSVFWILALLGQIFTDLHSGLDNGAKWVIGIVFLGEGGFSVSFWNRKKYIRWFSFFCYNWCKALYILLTLFAFSRLRRTELEKKTLVARRAFCRLQTPC